MKRITNYAAIYFITLVIYILTFNNKITDTLVFIAFTITSILFIFTSEGIPQPSKLKIPEVYLYQRKRLNIYGFIMSIGLIIGSIAFALISANQNIRFGIIILVIWPIMLVLSYLALIYHSNLKSKDLVYEYINNNISIKNQNLDNLISEIINLDTNHDGSELFNLLKRSKFSTEFSLPFLHETLTLYFRFKNKSNYSLLSDEIEEINN